MSEVKNTLQKHPVLRYSTMLFGMLMTSIGINGFLRPAHLLSGGATGIATSINYLTNINVGLLTFLINIPIFILGFIYLEKEFCISSLVNMIVFSLLLGATQEISNIIPIHDILLQSVYGGILSGLGVGVVFRTRSSQGGTDIIAAILKIKKNIEMKDTALAINGLIVLTGSFLFGLDLALYTLIGLFLNAYSMSFIKDAMNYQKSVMVMSNEVDLIAEDIMKSLVRGVTFRCRRCIHSSKKEDYIYNSFIK